MRLTKESILEAELKDNEAKELVTKIDNKIRGRICLSDNVHYLYVIKELLGEQCKNYLEIGVLHGGTSALVMQSRYPCKFMGVDIFTFYGQKTDKYAENIEVSIENAEKNINDNNIYNHPYKLIKGDSHEENTFSSVKEYMDNVDLLFIDGDHSCNGVVKDFEMYSPIVNKDGIILFDNYGEPNVWTGVKRGVDSLNLNNWEIIGVFGWSMIIQKK